MNRIIITAQQPSIQSHADLNAHKKLTDTDSNKASTGYYIKQ